MKQKRFLGLLSGTNPLSLADDTQMQGHLGFRVSGFRIEGLGFRDLLRNRGSQGSVAQDPIVQ